MKRLYNFPFLLLLLFCLTISNEVRAQASACPAVNAGTDVTICEGTCTTLNATIQGTVATSAYTVSSIPYNPYSYTTGTGVSVGVDDIWSGLINLPFCFQFFGNSYSRVVIGSNGVISFNTAYASTGSGYVICGAIPTNCGVTPLNAILGPWHDVDPSYGGTVRYQIYGTSPCRQLAVSWNNVPMFSSSCNNNSSLNATHQIVLHENTNIIDIYIKQKRVCTSWNGGDAIEGIQNSTGTVAYVVPGRNFPTNWTATNDGYRFTPAGAPQYTIEWRDQGGNVVGNSASVSVCPTTTTTYTAIVTNTTCSTPIIVNDAVTVTVNPKPTVSVNSPSICTGNSTNLTANGASTYTWTGGLPSNPSVTTPILSSSTSYTVTGTAANGCTNTAVANVTVNPLPTVAVNSPGICIGTSATITASGASTYTWSGGLPNGATVTTPILNSNTSYTVTGTDANGCTNTAVSNVTVTPRPNVVVNSPTICAGFTATLNASGANTYTWSGGLPAGATTTTPILNSNTNYTVTGTDANGCSNTAVSSITVNPSPTVNVNSPSICQGQSTSLTATGAISYTWTGGLPGSASVTTPILNSTTSYTVTGTGANGCTNSAVSTVTVNPLPTVNVNSPAVCTGFAANLSASGASTYTWTGGLPNGANVTTPVLTSNTSYTVTGTDGNGCVNTAVSNITVNPLPVVSASSPTICAGQTATLTATGANTYTWTGGLPVGSSTTTPVLNSTTSYTVTGTDGNGCRNTALSTVTVNPKPIVSVNSPAICSGQSASLSATGANTYTWTGGLPNGANVTTPILTSNTSYTVTGTDGNGCQNTAVSTVRVNPLPNVSVNSPSVCTGFTASLTANGASTYTWSGGLPTSSSVTTPVLTSNTSYTVTGTDGNGCINTATSNITVNPSPVVAVNSPTICAGQTASLSASGANTYTWTGGLPNGANPTTPVLNSTTSYTVTGTDGNGCINTAVSSVTVNPKPIVSVNSPTICSGQTANLNAAGANSYTWTGGLPAGANVTTPVLTSSTSYTVTGTDGNGCQNTALASVLVNPLPNVGVNSPAICFGTSTNLTATGANTYSWSGGLPNGASVNTPVLTSNTSYTVTGTDGNGCINNAVSNITINPSPVVSVTSPSICSGQTASISASGAGTYTWSGGLPNGANVNTPVLTSNTSYTVIGTDANGCKDTAVSMVTVNPLPNVGVNSPVICFGQTANLNATGATGYTWTGGLPAGSAVTTPILNTTTSYTVTGTDGNGCQNTALSTVTVNPLPIVSVNSPTICFGFSTNLTASGANTYSWSGGLPNGASVTTPVLTSSTSYTVTGTDGNGCQSTATSNITITSNPVIAVTSPEICTGQSTTITASGASTYTWSGGLPDGANTNTPVLTSTMNYTVIGADVNGCKDTAVSTVIVNPLPTVLVNSPTICAGLTASLNANGAASYTWTSGLPPNASVNTPILYFSDSYTVTGTDANGCQNSATSIITVNPKPNVTVNSPTICEGEFTTLTAAGALSYTWTGGLPNGAVVTTPALSTTMAYFVYGTDGNGCTNAARSVVTVNPIRSTSLIQAICQGESVTVGPRTFTTTGNYTVGLTTSLGCDSVITLDLTVNPVKTTNLRQTLCEGQFATVGGQTFLQSGIYTVELQTSNSCDSTVILDLTVKPNLLVEVDLVASQNNICYGTPVTFTATPRNGGTAPQFQWYMNSTPFGTNTNIFSSSTLNNLDQLQVTLVSSEMCVQNTPAFSPTIPMTVYRLDYIKPVIEYCTGDSRILDLSIPQTDYTIVWRNDNFIRTTQNTDELEINNTSSGFVDFTIQFGLNCTKHDTVNITVNPLPAVGLSVDEDTVRYGDTVQLTGIMPIPANTFSWTPATVNTTTILNPTAEVLAPTSFILEVTDIKGCRNRASVFVELLDECNSNYVFIPNAFTPNRDGLNDCFGAVDVSPHTDFHLVVFNRWGERLYESYDATQCWDGIYKGSDALMDTYPYVVTYRCYNGKFVEKHGILTLIR